ncbi:MAG: hypoxanthine phosphoribosyltransferase [Bacillota bacterium]
MKERVEVMLTAEEISKRIDELGAEISKKYAGEQVELVCVLKGGIFTLVELAKRLTIPVTMSFMDVSSYGDALESSGSIKILRDLDEDIAGKNVLLVEDIIDSGRTLSHLKERLIQRNPKSFEICTLLTKPSRRVVEMDVEYIGFEIPDAFVIGCGLDYKQRYRNLDYIGIMHLEEE